MQYFDGVIILRSGGDSRIACTEVMKQKMTVPEVMLLRKIHGADSVVKLTLVEEKNLPSFEEERARLSALYTAKAVTQFFGEWRDLPHKLPGWKSAVHDADVIEQTAADRGLAVLNKIGPMTGTSVEKASELVG